MRPVSNANEVVTYESPTPDHRKFRILVERDLSGSKSVAAGHLVLPPGASQASAEAHPNTEEIYYCARGRGKLLLDEEGVLPRGRHGGLRSAGRAPPGLQHRG